MIIPVMISVSLIFLSVLTAAKLLTTRLNKNNINEIGTTCLDFFKIDKQVTFQLDKNVKVSRAIVKKENSEYIVIIKDSFLMGRVSEIIHELTHIKTGQADRVKKLKNSVFNIILYNIPYDFFYAMPNEIKYCLWAKKEFGKV